MKEVFKKIMAPALTMTVLCGGLPAVSGVSTSLITAVTANAEVYSGIEVAGVEITSENADDILGDGVSATIHFKRPLLLPVITRIKNLNMIITPANPLSVLQ